MLPEERMVNQPDMCRGQSLIAWQGQTSSWEPILHGMIESYITERVAVFEDILEVTGENEDIVGVDITHRPLVAANIWMMETEKELQDAGFDTSIPSAYERYRQVFRKMYGSDFEDVRSILQRYPWTATAFDARGAIFLCGSPRWQKEKEEVAKAVDRYMVVFESLENSVKTAEEMRYEHLVIRSKRWALELARINACRRRDSGTRLQH